jgi:hypothetical protein
MCLHACAGKALFEAVASKKISIALFILIINNSYENFQEGLYRNAYSDAFAFTHYNQGRRIR